MVLHAIWQPSIVLLRVVPLASGLAALALNYWLCRRAFDRRTATLSTCILAVLPIDIAYSRFAWDASQSLLFTLPVLYLPLIECRRHSARARLSIGAVGALAAAILVHPTNVFDLPLIVLPPLVVRRTPDRADHANDRGSGPRVDPGGARGCRRRSGIPGLDADRPLVHAAARAQRGVALRLGLDRVILRRDDL